MVHPNMDIRYAINLINRFKLSRATLDKESEPPWDRHPAGHGTWQPSREKAKMSNKLA